MAAIQKTTGYTLAEIFRGKARPLASLLPEQIPNDITTAYALQNDFISNIGAIGGWKVGAVSSTAEPSCSPLPRERIYASRTSLSVSKLSILGIEAEIAFSLGQDLVSYKPYNQEEIAAAIISAHPVIEVISTRFQNWNQIDDLSKIADLQNHGALLIGEPVTAWQSISFCTQPLNIKKNGQLITAQLGGNGNGGNVLRLLTWLAAHATSRGFPLSKGDIITTGSWSGLHMAQQGDSFTVEFSGLGEVIVNLT